jgi:bifunctional DNase/RNase
LRASGGSIERVAITSSRDKVFYAAVSVNGEQVDARPSDALNLAVRAAAPILVEERLLDEHGLGAMTLIETIATSTRRPGCEDRPLPDQRLATWTAAAA